MGQLIGIPFCAADEAFDRRPKNISEYLIKGKVNGHRYLQYKKRSYDESEQRIAYLLFGNSLLEKEPETVHPCMMPVRPILTVYAALYLEHAMSP
jgi:hypothetical protein